MKAHRDPPARFLYAGDCTGADGQEIGRMRELAQDITYDTFRKNVEGLDKWAKEHGYDRSATLGLSLCTDWHVSYHKSKYAGVWVYYLVWSAFEHIWTPTGSLPRTKGDDDCVALEDPHDPEEGPSARPPGGRGGAQTHLLDLSAMRGKDPLQQAAVRRARRPLRPGDEAPGD